jgi:hypothetical protein
MTETYRPKELPNGFPLISEDVITQAWKDMDTLRGQTENVRRTWRQIKREEPHIARLVKMMASTSPSSQDVDCALAGTCFSYFVLKRLEALRAIMLPKVTKSHADSFLVEIANPLDLEGNPILGNFAQEQPYFSQEIFPVSEDDIFATYGAFLVYELKYRAFHSNQLQKQLVS